MPREVKLSIALILLALVAAYANSLDGAIVFDDASSIIDNPTLRDWSRPWQILQPPKGASLTVEGRPLLNLSLAIDYAIGGPAVTSFHVTNLAIHAFASLFLFGIVRRTLALPSLQGMFSESEVRFVALASAIVWAVHPLQTESVTYIVQRAESLAGMFFLATLYAFVRGATADAGTRIKWYGCSVAVCYLGAATKEILAAAPLLTFLYDRAFLAGSFRAAWRARGWIHASLASSWVLLAGLVIATGGRSGAFDFADLTQWGVYVLSQFIALTRYLRLAVWPHPLVFEYGPLTENSLAATAPAALFILALVSCTAVFLIRNRKLGFFGAWFFAILAPTSLAPGTTQMIVEHRLYLPLAALTVLAAVMMARIRPAIRGALLAAITLALLALTVRRNADYDTPETLWRDTIAKRPQNPLAHHQLAEVLDAQGDRAGAIAHFRTTLALKPGFSVAHARLADVLAHEGARVEAIEHYRAALAIRPTFVDAHANLGTILAKDRQFAGAIEHLEIAVRLDPRNAEFHYNLANAYADSGQTDRAEASYRQAIVLSSAHAAAHYNLANLLAAANRLPDARAHYEIAVKLRPTHAESHFNLGNICARTRDFDAAVAHYRTALQLNPDFAQAHNNLGNVLLELGRRDEARSEYETTLRLAPNNRAARENLLRLQNAGATPR